MRQYTKVNVHRISNGYVATFEMGIQEYETARRQFEHAENERLKKHFIENTEQLRVQFTTPRVFELYCADAERVAIAIHKYLKE